MQNAEPPAELLPILDAFVAWSHDRHVVTYAELNRVLPERDYSSREIELILGYLAGHGVWLADDDA
jgi:hypothetical protein